MFLHKEVLEILDYDPNTGFFTWRAFLNKTLSGRLRVFHRANKRAGYIAGKDGYRIIRWKGKDYLAHRLAWFYCYGVWPEVLLDHKNRVKDDNKISNLREVTYSGNSLNRRLHYKNTSGYQGVAFVKGKWKAVITVEKVSIYLGRHEFKWQAILARREAERQYGCVQELVIKQKLPTLE